MPRLLMEMKGSPLIEKVNQGVPACQQCVDPKIARRNHRTDKAASGAMGERPVQGDPFCASISPSSYRNAGKTFAET